jgi:hypothetical protein
MPATMTKLVAAALMAALMFITAAPAHSAEATPNDTARFLAGLSPADDSPLAGLTRDPAWQQHARYFNSIFSREESISLSKIRVFSRDRLPEKHDTMFYMFSGPDFLYAVSFFPSATTYVLAGLEPVGAVPQLTNLMRPTVYGTLRNLEVSLGTLLNYSFFITKNMKVQLHEGPVYGTLPILYVFLARTGKTVHEVSFGGLDRDGNFQVLEESAGADGKGGKSGKRSIPTAAPGVKIVFSDGDGPRQTLYYFSTDLSDGSVERSGFLAFCSKLGNGDSFIKSASYLLHTGGFNRVRNFLLEHSATILQDDSGIPFAYFDPKKWRLQPFGRYVGPLSIFGGRYQERMSELFRRNAIPIDFGIGYRWRRNESNLLLAERTATATSDNDLGTPGPANRDLRGTDSKQRKKERTRPAHRKRLDSDITGSIGCRITDLFPFCSTAAPEDRPIAAPK